MTPADLIGYAALGMILSFAFVAPLVHQWRHAGKSLIFPPKITGILGPVALLCLFVFVASDAAKHWSGSLSDWIWIGIPVPATLFVLRVVSPWMIRIDEQGIHTRTLVGRKRFIPWSDIGAVGCYSTTGRYSSSGCEIYLHGGEHLWWDDHFRDTVALAEVISRRTRLPLEYTQK